MKKCKKCGSKSFKESGKIFVCLGCHEIYSNQIKIDALKHLYQTQEKQNLKNAYNQEMEELQKRRNEENKQRKIKDSL
jgi:uncharacterized Zn finger protein (UPF0148 family)